MQTCFVSLQLQLIWFENIYVIPLNYSCCSPKPQRIHTVQHSQCKSPLVNGWPACANLNIKMEKDKLRDPREVGKVDDKIGYE